ncbi:hypothetical protein [uncultured Desulfobulbus sp.]|uniref:hypothetical protein n=1 Tax=uncultured Desulfobulbus sp. TaxID=239745 RepID=UPI0029C815A4|nr:hypothetical protein [uncultured Desulfobulbus sp.]
MEEQQGIIKVQELEACLKEIEKLVRTESDEADRRANDHRAPEYYRSDMQGYSRGVSVWGLKVVNMIRDMYCKD